MDLAFLCGLFPVGIEKNIISNSIGKIDYAANNLQRSFVNGLDKCNNKPIKIFNSLFIGSYPLGYKKSIIRTTYFSHITGSKDINIGFINLPVIKEIHKFYTIFIRLNKWLKENSEDKKVVLVYAAYTPFLLSIFFLKKSNKKIKTCLIIPDLPEYMSDNKNIFRLFFKFLNSLLIKKLLNSIDSFVLLTDFVEEKLVIKNKPRIRIEGIYDNEFSNNNEANVELDLKIIMYSGNLDKTQGIVELLNAFSKIEFSNYRLWFTGYGDSLGEILTKCKEDVRISYFERLSHIALLQKQTQSTILINPLSSHHPKVRYFFPSKTMEYLASGRPTLMHKLPCIPTEYYPHLFFFKDETIESIKELIIDVCNKSESELKNFGYNAREFIMNQKNPVTQCSKLYQMLLNL
jgi:glycosyltransferase involved in cell wall biosynthesis